MNVRFFLGVIAFVAAFVVPAKAQKAADVYTPIEPASVKVEASSSFPGFPAIETINGSGLNNRYHQSHNLGQTMWISQPSTSEVRAAKNTKPGVVWLMYTFDKVRKIDFLEIWNHNQSDHTNRGLQKIYLQYSSDGKEWHTLQKDGKDYFILPKSLGKKQEPADFQLELAGLSMKYFLITADCKEGNYYHDRSEKTRSDAAELNQNIDFYGLSEVRFYESGRVGVRALPRIDALSFRPSQAYLKSQEGPKREFTVKLPQPLYTGGKIVLEWNGQRQEERIEPSRLGITEFTSAFKAGWMESEQRVTVSLVSAQGDVNTRSLMPAARKWTIYFLPHSHLDIGYTHEHKDVLALQWRNLERAMDLAEASNGYPDGAKFRWNSETMWSVTEYLKKYKGTPKAERLIKAIKDGTIGLDASLGSILTGLCKQEEMTHLFDDAHVLAQKSGVEINTAMMSDIPGVSWGVVTAMAQNGVKYFSMAPNYVPFYPVGGSRVGNVHREWGDFPFYWQSGSGKEKILFWSAGKGYSFFHSWLADKLSACGTEPIWEYLTELEGKEYPYDMAYLRYTVYGDNGPPDEQMPGIIRAWNEKYEYPHFVIGTTKQLFTEFEERYASRLPVLRGDMTPFWEEGAASTATELAMNRRSSDRLNQSEILWSLADRAGYPRSVISEGWRNVVLFSEHTWGASASGPDPESEFTKKLWGEKRAFAVNADSLSRLAYTSLLNRIAGKDGKSDRVQVFNTQLWNRTDIVKLETSYDLSGKVLVDETGNTEFLQRGEAGDWLFIARDVPPLGSKVYRLMDAGKKQKPRIACTLAGDTLSNGLLSVAVDKANGAISSLTVSGINLDYAGEGGLNQYIYSARNAAQLQEVTAVKSITLLADGPVFATLRVCSDAPGTRSLIRDITLYKGIRRVDIVNTMDKLNVYDYENVRFKFPFSIPNSQLKLDLPFEQMGPEKDQLAGSNKNFYSVNNGVAVQGMKCGVLLTTLDTPILEIGEMTGETWLADTREFLEWKNTAEQSPIIYSWAMNNSWRTNYKASQSGICRLRYSIVPVDPNVRDSKQKGMEIAQPLVGALSSDVAPVKSLFTLDGKQKIAVSTIRPSKDGKGLLVRLVNTSRQSVRSGFNWNGTAPARIYECDNREVTGKLFSGTTFWMMPFETLTLKLEY